MKKTPRAQQLPVSQAHSPAPVWTLFAVLLLGAFVVLAIANGVFLNPSPPSTSPTATNTGFGVSLQKVSVRALGTGLYDTPVVRVKVGIPVEFSFSAEPAAGCGRQLLIPAFNVVLSSPNGQTEKATFTPTMPGSYPFHCSMNMFRGTLIVE